MLNRKVAIYIPSTLAGNEPAPAEVVASIVRRAKAKFAVLFGGFTAVQGQGGWVSEDHGLIEETVTIVQAFTTQETLDKHLPDIRALASWVALEMKQEAVSLEVNGTLEFIGQQVKANAA